MSCHPETGDSIMFLIKFPEKEMLYPIKVKFQSRRYIAFLKAFGERLVGILGGMSVKQILDKLQEENEKDKHFCVIVGTSNPEGDLIFTINGIL